jgi:hypothetical protein
MKIVGLIGGSSLCELGPTTDIQLFFDCLDTHVVQKTPERDWSLLTDRLYRRYLRLEELDTASMLMFEVNQVFASLPSTVIHWEKAKMDSSMSRLPKNDKTLADTFIKYFEHFAYCVESARVSYESFKAYPGYEYEAVRLVIADQPWFMVEKQRVLQEYDVLVGEPLWLR